MKGPGLWERWKHRADQLRQDTLAFYLAYQDSRTPWYARLLLAGLVLYLLSPLDLIPDFIPLLGHLDDLVLLPLGVLLARRLIPALLWEEAQERAREELRGGRPQDRRAALVVVLIWLLLLAGAVWIVVRATS